MPSLSPAILSVVGPFARLFSRSVWSNALTLVMGTILCFGKRTVCASLRIVGLGDETRADAGSRCRRGKGHEADCSGCEHGRL